MYTLLYLKCITNKDLPYNIGNSAQSYMANWMGGQFGGGIDTCMFVAEFLCCPLEAIITVLISYTPIYAKKNFLKYKVKRNSELE